MFEVSLERVLLLAELRPGQIVVMDNLSQSPQEDAEGQGGVGRRSRMRVALPATLLLT